MRVKLLFTGGGGAGNEALYRLWGDQYELHFADADVDAIAPLIPQARRHVIPMASAEDFASTVAALCRSIGIEILIPGVDEELPALAALSQETLNFKVLLPELDYVATMLDKQAMVDALNDKGLPAPRTLPLANSADLGFPCFAKPRSGRGSRGVRVIDNLTQALALESLETDAFIAQDLLAGQEYTVMMAADMKGRLGAVVPVRVDIKRGITLRAETEFHAGIIDACSAIHVALPARGCYNIQLMLGADGTVLPFEINPRISTTFCLAVAAGIDPIRIFVDGADDTLMPFIEGLKLSRAWFNHFQAMADA
ncbi:MAG: ATP-grasp domain-containing protein [Rhodospirillales bacterium]|nr:ATP-grasp domain-containing protein [Rhodospirillales bacterium]